MRVRVQECFVRWQPTLTSVVSHNPTVAQVTKLTERLKEGTADPEQTEKQLMQLYQSGEIARYISNTLSE